LKSYENILVLQMLNFVKRLNFDHFLACQPINQPTIHSQNNRSSVGWHRHPRRQTNDLRNGRVPGDISVTGQYLWRNGSGFCTCLCGPRDIQGLTIVEATRSSDRRELEETADVETPDTGITRDGFYSKTFSFPKNGYLCARSINTRPNLSNISRRITEHASVLVFQDKAMS
jgi:hypothetical protein